MANLLEEKTIKHNQLMKKLITLLSIFTIFLSCSSDETSTLITPSAPVKYTITLTAGEGGTVSTTGGEYDAGQTVSVTATPQGEYLFKDWSDGNTDTTRTITVNSNSTLTANFEKRKYPLTINFEGEGEVIEEIVNVGRSTDYDSGTTVKLTAMPAEGWEFVGWEGALNGSSNPQELAIIESKSITATFEKLTIESITLTNPIDEIVISQKHKFQISGIYKNGNQIDLTNDAEIAALDDKILVIGDEIIALKSGISSVSISYQNLILNTEINVKEFEFIPIDPSLIGEKTSKLEVPVIILSYLPTSDGINLDMKRAPDGYWKLYNSSLVQAKNKILQENISSKKIFEEGTKYRDYGTNKVNSYINFNIVSYINIYEIDFIPTDDGQEIDYYKLFEKLNLKSIINQYSVKEIWFNHYPVYNKPALTNNPEIFENAIHWGLDESNMSSPNSPDISNSSRKNDLPICNNTFVVYAFNQAMGVSNHIHCKGHQIEAQLSYIENKVIYPSGNVIEETLFWGKFVGIKNNGGGWLYEPGRAGRVHNPPNTFDNEQYGYSIDRNYLSDIMNWRPDGGEFKSVNFKTWTDIEFKYGVIPYNNIGGQPYTSEIQWLTFWSQSIPGENNNIPYTRDGMNYKLTNWWDLFYNWDEAITRKKTLWE